MLQYGISGPYWYAGGATIQIIIFSILSIMLKTRAPGAKTFLQVRLAPLSNHTIVHLIYYLLHHYILDILHDHIRHV